MAEPASHTGRALLDYDAERAAVLEAGRALIPALSLPAVVRDAVADRARDSIVVHRAREHNLRDIEVTIPRDGMTVLTGVSGSGKSTLAFDIIFAEGQRRYLESLNAYARQFVQPASRPDVDAIFGIPPTVAIEQRTSRGGRKSTVGTLTEVHHFLRLLYVKLGVQHCPDCHVPIEPQSADSIAALLLREAKGRKHRVARAAGRVAQGLLHGPREVGAREGLRGTARRRRNAADRPVAPSRPVPRAHDRIAGRHREGRCRDGSAAAGRARPRARIRQGRGTHRRQGPHARLLDPSRLPVVRAQFRRARSAPVLLQLQARLVRGLFRHRPADQRLRRGAVRRGSLVERLVRRRSHRVPGLRGPAAEPRRAQRHVQGQVDRRVVRVAGRAGAVVLRRRCGCRGARPRSRATCRRKRSRGWRSSTTSAWATSRSTARRRRCRAARRSASGWPRSSGSNLQGVCYVLDEPTIGLHPRDNRILLDSLQKLASQGQHAARGRARRRDDPPRRSPARPRPGRRHARRSRRGRGHGRRPHSLARSR